MEIIKSFIDFILHLDVHLFAIVQQYGTLVYLLLFVIIFCETGLVITPFLPGDSLLFVAGTLSAQGSINIFLLAGLMFIAAILGDAVNYWIGHYIGPKVFENKRFKLINKEHLQKAQKFYEQKGPIVIVIARFIPIVRTFAPFVAGVSKMNFIKFAIFNIAGGFIWVSLMTFGGYFFGNIPIIKENITHFSILIIIVSLIPVAKELIQKKVKKNRRAY
ncbi:DedA family protein [Bacillus sp. 03113]|uniref:DedA family protein n=1 Tax=Bacillus sp. 03113 TaxID=2578211 RepID=UPI0011415232|nr:DedA family protein [Bacillus sp. 03113]